MINRMALIVRALLVALFLAVTAGCVSAPRPVLDFTPGAVVATLSSPVSMSIQAADRGMAGHGYLIFRRPGQARMVILSPFGTTIMEAIVSSDRITLLYPGQMTAYSGRLGELPDKGGLQGWRLMQWVMDAEPPGDPSRNGTVERMGKQGFNEKLTFENGLVVAKESQQGDRVYYEKYVVINGVPLATEVDMRNARDDRVSLKLDEPEINTPLDDDVFQPKLDGYTILPLSALAGL